MNAKELADKFKAKTDAAVVERKRQSGWPLTTFRSAARILNTASAQWRATFCRSWRS